MKNVRRIFAFVSALMLIGLFPAVSNAEDVAASDQFLIAVSNKTADINVIANVDTNANLTVNGGTHIAIALGCTWTITGGEVKVFGSISGPGSVVGSYTRYVPASSIANWIPVSNAIYVGFTDHTSTRSIVSHNGSVYLLSDFSGKTVSVIESADGSVYKQSSSGTLSKVHSITYVEPEENNIITSASPTEFLEADGAVLPTSEPYEKTGYTFVGWSTDSAATAANITSIAPNTTTSQTVYAVWQADAPTGAPGAGAFAGFASGSGGGRGSVSSTAEAAESDDEDEDDNPSAAATAAPQQQQTRVVRANSSTKVTFKDDAALDMSMPLAESVKKPLLSTPALVIVGGLILGLAVFGILRYNKHVNDTWTDEDDDEEFRPKK